MCKIMVIPGINDKTRKAALSLIQAAAPLLSKNDRDGFGYAAVNSSGLYGERWLRNSDAFKTRSALSSGDLGAYNRMSNTLSYEPKYNNFGSTDNSHLFRSIILHSRAATCAKTLQNVHPFVKGNTALIHNGVISNSETLGTNVTSTCDSEVILHSYVDNSVDKNIDNIQKAVEPLYGYFACAVLTQHKKRWVVDVFKESRANLIAARIEELDQVVFCTTADILLKAAKQAGLTVGTTFTFNPNSIIRLDAFSGGVITQAKFKVDATIHHSSYTYNHGYGLAGYSNNHGIVEAIGSSDSDGGKPEANDADSVFKFNINRISNK